MTVIRIVWSSNGNRFILLEKYYHLQILNQHLMVGCMSVCSEATLIEDMCYCHRFNSKSNKVALNFHTMIQCLIKL